MSDLNLTEEDIDILNSKLGLRRLLADKKLNVERSLRLARYDLELEKLQAELIELQNWVIANNKKVVVIFEGRDGAGKGGAIRRISAHINPRMYRVVALPKPTEDESKMWYFQRYVNQLPKPGEIVFFDRSWYNRAVVEPVNGFCTQEEHETFMRQVNAFEEMVQSSDTYLIKLYFSITKDEQALRFQETAADPLKKWKLTAVDMHAQELWDEYTRYKEKMFRISHTENAPWIIIQANRKTEARIAALEHIIRMIPFRNQTEE